MTTPTPWPKTGRGRKEIAAVSVFVLLVTVVPLWRTELYPFSRSPMFADAPRRYCNYRVLTADGRPLDPREFGVQRNYWGNPLGVGAGFLPAESADRFGEVPDREAVTALVAARLASHPELESIELLREVIGPLESGGVGVVRTESWRIDNPLHRKDSGR
jgi:hypothetical protein